MNLDRSSWPVRALLDVDATAGPKMQSRAPRWPRLIQPVGTLLKRTDFGDLLGRHTADVVERRHLADSVK